MRLWPCRGNPKAGAGKGEKVESQTTAIIAVGVGLGGLIIALAGLLVVLFQILNKRIDGVERRLDSLEQRFGAHTQHTDERFDAQTRHTDDRLDAHTRHTDARFDALQASVSEVQQRYSRLEGMLEAILNLLSRSPLGR